MTHLDTRTVLISGATSASGAAAARALAAAGARVIVVGRDPDRVYALAEATAGDVWAETCDLAEEDSVRALALRVLGTHGTIDGVLHLVGGWRGGGGLEGQSEADFRFLENSLSALRHVSRAFDADLRASTAARTAMVTSEAVLRPLAGGANYAAVKAASEAWMRAVAQGFAKSARDASAPLHAAAVTFRVKELSGREDVLARTFVSLWEKDAAEINDTVIPLTV